MQQVIPLRKCMRRTRLYRGSQGIHAFEQDGGTLDVDALLEVPDGVLVGHGSTVGKTAEASKAHEVQ